MEIFIEGGYNLSLIPLLDLAKNVKEGKIPHVSYHRKCRSLFTTKRDLESISQTTAAASQTPEFNKRRARSPSGRTKHDQNASQNMQFLPKDNGI